MKATALHRNQRPRASFSLAGFQVTLIGRFWVTAEAMIANSARLLAGRIATASGFVCARAKNRRPSGGNAKNISFVGVYSCTRKAKGCKRLMCFIETALKRRAVARIGCREAGPRI